MRFADAAQEAFSFLEDVGFRLVQRESAHLQYESEQSVFAIEWDARSGEINVLIGLQPREGEPRDAFSLSDLLSMQRVEVPERYMPFQVANENRLAPFLEKLAEDTRVHARPALAGDRMFFRRLETFRNAQSQKYMRDMKLRYARSEADKAWQKREFEKLITLYASIEDDLSESEKGKLDYAQRHSKKQ